MDAQLLKTIQEGSMATPATTQTIETGMEVEVTQLIVENGKERTQKFRGLVITTKGKTLLDRVITVRAVMDGIGIEKIFPVNSPFVREIKILRKFKVRRKQIGFIRELTGKAARLKEIKGAVATAE